MRLQESKTFRRVHRDSRREPLASGLIANQSQTDGDHAATTSARRFGVRGAVIADVPTIFSLKTRKPE